MTPEEWSNIYCTDDSYTAIFIDGAPDDAIAYRHNNKKPLDIIVFDFKNGLNCKFRRIGTDEIKRKHVYVLDTSEMISKEWKNGLLYLSKVQ